MQNVHVRRVAAPIERVRPWIEACWSGGVRDCFPRDVIPSWRRNPPGVDPSALIPGETIVGHGPFRFRLRAWDGQVWRVDLVGPIAGWHGFDLVPDGEGCRVTHTLELDGSFPSATRRTTMSRSVIMPMTLRPSPLTLPSLSPSSGWPSHLLV